MTEHKDQDAIEEAQKDGMLDKLTKGWAVVLTVLVCIVIVACAVAIEPSAGGRGKLEAAATISAIVLAVLAMFHLTEHTHLQLKGMQSLAEKLASLGLTSNKLETATHKLDGVVESLPGVLKRLADLQLKHEESIAILREYQATGRIMSQPVEAAPAPSETEPQGKVDVWELLQIRSNGTMLSGLFLADLAGKGNWYQRIRNVVDATDLNDEWKNNYTNLIFGGALSLLDVLRALGFAERETEGDSAYTLKEEVKKVLRVVDESGLPEDMIKIVAALRASQ